MKPGDTYTVKVSLSNEGSAPIQIKDMIVTTTINGRKASGPVPPLVKEVAPAAEGALLLTLAEHLEGRHDLLDHGSDGRAPPAARPTRTR